MFSTNIFIATLATVSAATVCLTPSATPQGFVFGKERAVFDIVVAKGPEGEDFSLKNGTGNADWYDVPNAFYVQVHNSGPVARTINIGLFDSAEAAKSGIPSKIATATLPPAGKSERADATPCIAPAPEHEVYYAIAIV